MSDTTEIAGTLAGLKALDEETIAALQAQLDEEIRLNAMGSEREARLMARLAECERLRATGVEAIRRLNTEVELISIDRDTLRAQLTETQRLLEVQGDKLTAEVARLTNANEVLRGQRNGATEGKVSAEAELAALREAISEMIVDGCDYGDDCTPEAMRKHYKCRSCRLRDALGR